MRQSQLFTRTKKQDPAGEVSANAKLLERGGFMYKNSAGIYSYLPLGWRVMQNIATIIREEMNAIGGQELLMPALVEKKIWESSGRWDVPIGFEVRGKEEKTAQYVLGWTHEEVLTDIVSKYIDSYDTLPFAAYQIQTKFRNEPRAKSGILRGKEFMMKDLYSFHTSEKDMFEFYEKVKGAYLKVFERCGLKAIYTVAAGGTFTISNTHEFQVLSDVGEDTILVCSKCGYAENSEISKLRMGEKCPKCGGLINEEKSIEVGNIFPLGTKYSKALNLTFMNEAGEKELVVMGSYGIGVGRVMGTVVETNHDERGIMWPKEIAPFSAHLVLLQGEKNTTLQKEADSLYNDLVSSGVEILYDDRLGVSAGEKFADADLLGIPLRILISEKTQGKIEVKARNEKEVKLLNASEVKKLLKKE